MNAECPALGKADEKLSFIIVVTIILPEVL